MLRTLVLQNLDEQKSINKKELAILLKQQAKIEKIFNEKNNENQIYVVLDKNEKAEEICHKLNLV